MSLDDFSNDNGSQLDNEDDPEKIKYNQKFKFLPQCEKYVNEETLFKSKNLVCLTKAQKEQLIEVFKNINEFLTSNIYITRFFCRSGNNKWGSSFID